MRVVIEGMGLETEIGVVFVIVGGIIVVTGSNTGIVVVNGGTERDGITDVCGMEEGVDDNTLIILETNLEIIRVAYLLDGS